MLTGKKIILFGAGEVGVQALEYFGMERVFCFCDSKKTGYSKGKHIISPDELSCVHHNYDVIITIKLPENIKAVSGFLSDKGIPFSLIADCIDISNYSVNNELQKFEGKYKGQRVFLIGNGPSLTVNDLNTIKANNEISFGCNRICKIFDKTDWRPDYYFLGDEGYVYTNLEDIKQIESVKFFSSSVSQLLPADFGDFVPFYSTIIMGLINANNHSESRIMYCSSSIMTVLIQTAYLMGFSEAYLLGVDFTYKPLSGENHFNRFHFYEDNDKIKLSTKHNIPTDYENKLIVNQYNSYNMIRDIYKDSTMRIYNATRVRNLDVFEHSDFDSLFSDKRS